MCLSYAVSPHRVRDEIIDIDLTPRRGQFQSTMDNTYDNSGSEQAGAVTLPRDYKPNAEEMKLLAECRSEAKRKGIVSALLFGALTYQSVKSFNLKLHPTYGMYPKVGSAVICGYFLGKFMAIPSCYQKFKNIPDSPIGAYLRQKKAGLSDGLQLSMESTADASLNFPVGSPARYKDNRMNSAIDIDVYSSPSDMDSYTGNELNGPVSGDDSTDRSYATKPTVSYAELRKRNREVPQRGDTKERYNSLNPVGDDAAAGPSVRRSSRAGSFDEKNKYGDVWG